MDLLEELASHQKNMSWFLRVALHIHSPGSHDWGQGSKADEDNREMLISDPAPYLNCLAENYDLVAITDHMQTSFVYEKCKDFKKCVILPGMELTVKLKPPFSSMHIHFLAIFPERASGEEIERIFHDTGIPGSNERKGNETFEVGDIIELAKRVQNEKGILIAAHIDSDKGYRRAFREVGNGVLQLVCSEDNLDDESRAICEQFKEHLLEAKIDAVEIHSLSDVRHYHFTIGQQKKMIATVLRNDSHSLEELRGGKCTYIKMTETNLSGLSQALRFPDTRVRHEKPTANLPCIVGIRISGGKAIMNDVTLAFSPHLSCIIGARGTGKSAIVDSIRYAFGYNKELGHDIEPDLADQVKNRQKATLQDATIEIIYKDSNEEIHRLISKYSPNNPYSTSVYDKTSRPRHVPVVETDGRFPCRLYGWSEIERLGRDTPRQRALIDRILDLHGDIQKRDALLKKLDENRSRIDMICASLDRIHDDSNDLKHLKEYQADFDLIKDPKIEVLFDQVDQEEKKLSVADQWEQQIIKLQAKMEEFVDLVPPQWDKGSHEVWVKAGGEKALKELNSLGEALKQTIAEILQAARAVKTACAEAREGATLDLSQRIAGEHDISDLARKRSTLADNLNKAKDQKRLYEERFNDLRIALNERLAIAEKLNEVLTELSGNRKEGITQLNERLAQNNGPDIRVIMRESSDIQARSEWLDNMLKTSNIHPQTRKRISKILISKLGLDGISSAFLDGKCPEDGFEEADKTLINSLLPFYEDVGSGVTRIHPTNLNNVLKYSEHPLDDIIEVTLGVKAIGDLSPGQRCSALLPIIVLGSNVPLLIDQPEDNLDNQLVTELMIRTLHDLKEHRQIIVVTHNPNIVVSGDAEQVIVMHSEDGKCSVRHQASIDKPEIMSDVIQLMEGGEEAFLRRYIRYGF